HVLCNNAGVALWGGLERATHRDWQWAIGVNLWGVIHGVETFVPRMIAAGEPGHVVNTASMAGLIASQGLGVYNTTKYAVVGLSETLQKDLRGYGIGVSVLCPMGVKTAIRQSARNRPDGLRNAGAPDSGREVDLIGRYLEVAGVAVDKQDNVFCFSRGEHPVIVFDREGRFLRSWGEGHVRRAHAITIDADETVWLTDDLHHTVRKFTADGKLLLTIGNPDKPSELQGGKPFNRPTHVAICPRTGSLFISDGYGNSRVHKYAPDGRHVMSWGEPGADPGQFNLPHNVATDAEGVVYVADRENHRVQIFDSQGRYQGQWNNLHRPCGLFADRRDGDHLYIGELGAGMAVNEQTPNLGPRVTVLTLKGERVCRFGGLFP